MTIPAIHADPTPGHGKAMTLALTLAEAERAIHEFAAGQVDAIVDANGNTYLMRAAQDDLRQSERRLRSIVDASADVITVVSRSGRILSQSQAVRRVFGFEPEYLLGQSIFDLIYDGDLDRLYTAFFNVIEGFEETALAQFHLPGKDGSYRRLEATVGKLCEGVSTKVVLSMRPVTSRRPEPAPPVLRRIDAAPVKVDRDRFLAMLSHELRTPLSAILLGVEELEEDERFAVARPSLAMMRRNIELQTRLIEELTDFAAVGQHKVRLRLEPLDAHEHILFVLEICRSELAAAKIDVRLDLAAVEHTILADTARLQQVMWNLVRNAIKFSPPGGSISISSANSAEGSLIVQFADHGIGIEAALLPLVFDPFQQGDAEMQHRYGGLGLGLYIAKGLAEAQQGTLAVASEGRSRGAMFSLAFNTTPSNASHTAQAGDFE